MLFLLPHYRLNVENWHTPYVSGSSKIQTLLSSNVVEITLHGFKLCKSMKKCLIYQIAIMFGFYLNDSHIYVYYTNN